MWIQIRRFISIIIALELKLLFLIYGRRVGTSEQLLTLTPLKCQLYRVRGK
jgi:hypothetical protein